MYHQNNINDELRNLDSSLPESGGQPTFSVPDGYFDGLAASILAKVKDEPVSASNELQELSPLLAGLSRQTLYSVPEGYFDSNIAALSFLLAEEESSPVLAAAGKQPTYQVPQDYFENLPGQILAKATRPEQKVVSMFARTWMRAAVAAAIGGIVLFGGYRLLNDADNEQPLATVSPAADSSDKGLAKNEMKPAGQDLKDVSTEEMDAFIKAVPVNPGKLQSSVNSNQKEEVLELLKDVSEKEIDIFLEQIPTADDDLPIID